MDNTKKPLNGRLEQFRIAIEEEIKEIKKNSAASAVPLMHGSLIRESLNEYIYRFRVDTTLNLPSDTPVTLGLNDKKYDAVIISLEEPYIVLMTQKNLGDYIGYARVESDLSILMEKLIKRIEEKSNLDNVFGMKMLDVNSYTGNEENLLTIPATKNLTNQQKKAVQSAIGRDLTYIWGPPGTGKTYVIAEIIEELFRRDKTVLLVSHTNTAVDGAIKASCEELCEELHKFPILRLGQTEKIFQYPEATLKYQIKIKSKELTEELERVSAVKDNLNSIKNTYQHIVESCSQGSDTLISLRRLEEDCRQTNEYIKESAANDLFLNEAISRLDNDILKKPNIDQYNKLLKEQNLKRESLNQQQMKTQKLIDEFTFIKNRIKEVEENLVYWQKYEELGTRKAQLFSLEKQKDIIKKIKSNVLEEENELKYLKNKEVALEEMLHQAQNANIVFKIINRTPNAKDVQVDLDLIIERIEDTKHKLAGLKRLEVKNKNEYEEIISINSELDSFPRLLRKSGLIEEKAKIEARIGVLTTEIEIERNRVESQHKAVNVGIKEIEVFLKSIDFNIEEAIEKIIVSERQVKKYKGIAKSLDTKIAAILNEQYNISYQPEASEIGYNKLLKKLEDLKHLLNSIEEELQCFSIEEFIKKRLQTTHEINKIIEELEPINRSIEAIKAKLAQIENSIIANAKIIGTTLTKGYLSDEIHKRKFDTVILDEASMASIPMLWIIAYLATGRIIIVGDFKQLPPVALSMNPIAQEWIAKDIFRHSQVEEQCDKNYKGVVSENVVILYEQFRMHRQIAALANYYYNGKLKSPNDCADKTEFSKWYSGIGEKTPISIIDTKNFNAWVTSVSKNGNSSRINYLSATLCVALAKKLIENLLKMPPEDNEKIKVLIICPYRPHAKRMQQLIEQEGIDNIVRAGTIHSFQGSEADIVIFDLVVDQPHWRVALFNPDNNELNKRLFNVAITRAKHRLFFVGNIDYCLQKSNKDSELRRLLSEIKSSKNVDQIDGKEIFPSLYPNRSNAIAGQIEFTAERMCVTQESFYDYFYQDVKNAKNRIIIYSPFIASDRLGEVIGYLQHSISDGVMVYVVTKAPTDRKVKEASKYESYINQLKVNGIKVIYKKSMHEKLLFIDNDIVWAGSLNALSFSNTQEVMERRVSKEIFDDYIKIMHIEDLIDRMGSSFNKCPICDHDLILAEGKGQPFYYRCINDNCFTMSVGQQYPQNGLLTCEKCEGSLSFSMKNEPRWVCDSNKKHYLKIWESHLKLPKMLEKIPKLDREVVEKYFLGAKAKKEFR